MMNFTFSVIPAKFRSFLIYLLGGLLLATAVATYPAPAQDIPNWSKQERKDIQKHFEAIRSLYEAEADPYKQKKIAQKELAWFSKNKGIIVRQKSVYNLIHFYFGAGGYSKSDEEDICENLANALESFDSLDPTEGSERRLIGFLMESYKIDKTFFDKVYTSWYPLQHDFVAGESCSKDPVPVIEIKPVPEPVLKNPDSDNDGIVDAADKCPMKWGLAKDQGCPTETFTSPTGLESTLTPEDSYYIDQNGKRRDMPQDEVFIKMLSDSQFNTEYLRLDQVSTGPVADSFDGSDYVLIQLTLLDSLGHQVIRFPTAEYTINRRSYLGFHNDFKRSFNDFLHCVNVLTEFFELNANDFRILVQGIADNPPINPCITLPSGHQSNKQYMEHTYYTFKAGKNKFVSEVYTLEDECYDNDDLPFLRGSWLYKQIRSNIKMDRFLAEDYIIPVKGIVLSYKNEVERSGVLYLAMDRKKLAKAAIEKRKKIAGGTLVDTPAVRD